MRQASARPINLLLVEDNPGDVRLTIEALKEVDLENHLAVVNDGDEALDYLHHRGRFTTSTRPDMILLDLNLPRLSGGEVLEVIKRDESLKSIPVVVLTTSGAVEDITHCYDHHANCYIKKPVDMDEFIDVVKAIDLFWFKVATLAEV